MYEAFYGLSEKPFNLTPDPKYLFLSEKHKEAFAHLLYGIKSGSGFVMVTGEIGTGKTTICRNLVRQLDEDTELAFIFNPSLKPVELIKKILTEFGLTPVGDDILDLVEELNAYLLEAKSRGRNCVLLIDEAQNLSPQVLEQIRLLSNLETETEKLLQIVLVGQPELGEMLALHELRQLNQRITARYHLKELNEKETLQYVAYRLHAAGGRRSVRFNRSAIRQIYKRSGGTPRMINAICDRALLIGYTKEARIITSAIVKRAALEIRGEKVVTRRDKRGPASPWRWSPSPALLVAAVVAYVILWQFGPALSEFTNGLRAFRDVVALAVPASRVDPPAAPAASARTVDVDTPPAEVPRPGAASEKASENDVPALVSQELWPTLLAASDGGTTCGTASEKLLSIWGVALPEGTERPQSPSDLIALASDLGLKHERIRPALSQLVALDLPALIRVRVGETGGGAEDRWLALVGADDDHLRVTTVEDAVLAVRREVLQGIYEDEAIVLWRDDEPKAPDMMLGRKDAHVAALKTNLRNLGRLGSAATDNQYDSDTARAISKIQAETGLIVDGIAGRQVRMVLSSWLRGDGVPTLKPALPGETTPDHEKVIARATDIEAPPAPAAKPEAPAAPTKAAESAEKPTPEEAPVAPKAEEADTPTPEEVPVAPKTEADTPTPEAEAIALAPEEDAPAAPEAETETDVAPAGEEPLPVSTVPPTEAETESLVSIEDLEVPFFPAGLGPLGPSDLKERTEPAPDITIPNEEGGLDASTGAPADPERN